MLCKTFSTYYDWFGSTIVYSMSMYMDAMIVIRDGILEVTRVAIFIASCAPDSVPQKKIGEFFKDAKEKESKNQAEKNHDLSIEIHTAKTKDGFHLNLHRIRNTTVENPTVCLIQHGLMLSSGDWLLPGGLAYTLVNQDCDVWMGDFRANIFSHDHDHLTNRDQKYWKFSWDEHAQIDLPAMIDFVLEKTGEEKLVLIAHSMGTTASLAMLSSLPEFNKKIRHAIMIAPVTVLKHMKGIPRLILPMAETLVQILESLGIYWVGFPRRIPGFMGLLLSILYTFGFYNLTTQRLQQLVDFAPAGSSIFTFKQYFQNYRAQKFMSLDKSREYDLKNVTCNLTMWYSDSDWSSCKQDCLEIADKVQGRVASVNETLLTDFGHLDFLWDPRAKGSFYQELIKDLKYFLEHY